MRKALQLILLTLPLSSPLTAQAHPPARSASLQQWVGWYRNHVGVHGVKNDHLLITLGKDPDTLHVSGRAYLFGISNPRSGSIIADATPSGSHLHLVAGDDPDDKDACTLDLTLNPNHTLTAADNNQCGGMSVTFSGKWSRFTPTTRAK